MTPEPKYEEFYRLVCSIAKVLGFQAGEHNPHGTKWVTLTGQNGQALHIGTEWNNHEKLVISGVYPGGTQYMTYRDSQNLPKIGVSMSRGVEAIVKEINRRLMPEYLRILAVCQAGEERHKASDAKRGFTLQWLASIIKDSKPNNSAQSLHINGAATGKLYGDIEVYDTDVTMKLNSVPVELAVKIAQAIAEHYKTT